jgi:hypothetical protein
VVSAIIQFRPKKTDILQLGGFFNLSRQNKYLEPVWIVASGYLTKILALTAAAN